MSSHRWTWGSAMSEAGRTTRHTVNISPFPCRSPRLRQLTLTGLYLFALSHLLCGASSSASSINTMALHSILWTILTVTKKGSLSSALYYVYSNEYIPHETNFIKDAEGTYWFYLPSSAIELSSINQPLSSMPSCALNMHFSLWVYTNPSLLFHRWTLSVFIHAVFLYSPIINPIKSSILVSDFTEFPLLMLPIISKFDHWWLWLS